MDLNAVKPNFPIAEYFHVVFTVPQEIAAIAFYNKELVYGILFRATAQTLLDHSCRSRTSGADIGFLRRSPQLGAEPALEPSLMMRVISISFVFSKQLRLVLRTIPL